MITISIIHLMAICLGMVLVGGLAGNFWADIRIRFGFDKYYKPDGTPRK